MQISLRTLHMYLAATTPTKSGNRDIQTYCDLLLLPVPPYHNRAVTAPKSSIKKGPIQKDFSTAKASQASRTKATLRKNISQKFLL